MKRITAILKEPWPWLTLAVAVAILARDAEETLQTYLLAVAAAAGITAAGVITKRILQMLERPRTEESRLLLRRVEEERDGLRGQLRRTEEQVGQLEAKLKELQQEADRLRKAADILSVEEAEELKKRGVWRIYASRERAAARIAELVMTQADTKLGEIQVVAVAGRELLHWDKGVKYEDIPLVEALRNRLTEPGNHTNLSCSLLSPNCDEAKRRDHMEGTHETIPEITMSRANFLDKFGSLVKSNRAQLEFYTKRPSMFGIRTAHGAIVQHYAEAPRRLSNPPDPDHPWAEGCYGDVYPVSELKPGTLIYDTFTEEIKRMREDQCKPAGEAESVSGESLPPCETPEAPSGDQ